MPLNVVADFLPPHLAGFFVTRFLAGNRCGEKQNPPVVHPGVAGRVSPKVADFFLSWFSTKKSTTHFVWSQKRSPNSPSPIVPANISAAVAVPTTNLSLSLSPPARPEAAPSFLLPLARHKLFINMCCSTWVPEPKHQVKLDKPRIDCHRTSSTPEPEEPPNWQSAVQCVRTRATTPPMTMAAGHSARQNRHL